MDKWFQRFRTRLQSNLLQLDQQPLGKSALIVLIFLDVFIVISVFDGLANHTRQLVHPNDVIPQLCREIYIEQRWNETTRIDLLENYVNRYRERSHRVIDRNSTVHPVCAATQSQFDLIKNNLRIGDQLKTLNNLKTELALTQGKLRDANALYQTNLLEKIADAPVKAESTANEREVQRAFQDVEKYTIDIQKLEAALLAEAEVHTLVSYLQAIAPGDREILAEEYRHLNFWFPVKKLAMELLFLAPLVLAFYFWNANAIKRARPYQILISSHLLVVIFVPVTLKVVEILYDIIPQRLLQNLISVLESLGLVAIWHYLVMLAAIVGASALIYLFQKKLFSQEKEVKKRIAKGQCQSCAFPLGGSQACSQCGFQQFEPCSACREPTFIHGQFCRHCGEPRLSS